MASPYIVPGGGEFPRYLKHITKIGYFLPVGKSPNLLPSRVRKGSKLPLKKSAFSKNSIAIRFRRAYPMATIIFPLPLDKAG
jgi:hypothetical protein